MCIYMLICIYVNNIDRFTSIHTSIDKPWYTCICIYMYNIIYNSSTNVAAKKVCDLQFRFLQLFAMQCLYVALYAK